MKVHCTVDNCQWWDSNYCAAQSILITSDSIGFGLPDELDYPDTKNIVEEHGLTPVDECMDTCCKTFTQKLS